MNCGRWAVKYGVSMSRGQNPQGRSPAFLISSWVCTALSIGLLIFAGRAVLSDLGSFRSCGGNSVLAVHACGKQSPNVGDLILFALFILSACLVVSLFTGSWRATKGSRR